MQQGHGCRPMGGLAGAHCHENEGDNNRYCNRHIGGLYTVMGFDIKVEQMLCHIGDQNEIIVSIIFSNFNRL